MDFVTDRELFMIIQITYSPLLSPDVTWSSLTLNFFMLTVHSFPTLSVDTFQRHFPSSFNLVIDLPYTLVSSIQKKLPYILWSDWIVIKYDYDIRI